MVETIPVPGRSWLQVVPAGPPGTIEVHGRCITCGRHETMIDVPAIDFGGWLAGALIQRALPKLGYRYTPGEQWLRKIAASLRALTATRGQQDALPLEAPAIEDPITGRLAAGPDHFYLRCLTCGERISTALPNHVIIRAVYDCPECYATAQQGALRAPTQPDGEPVPLMDREPPPYASDLSLWEPWGRDLYYSRHLNATKEVTPWEKLGDVVRRGWMLAAHDYHRGPHSRREV